MKPGFFWSLSLGKGFGIPIKLHWSFLVFLAWIAFSEFSSFGQPLKEVLFVALLFGCIVLHELGHALMARYFGIKTRDITLYPIGGVALLEREPKALQELLIALAGPLVTALLALGFFASLSIDAGSSLSLLSSDQNTPSFAQIGLRERLFWANLVLLVFNMIPAFPMDGGRALRALLTITIGESRANLMTSRLAQILSIGFFILGLWAESPGLVVIAILVFLNASEARLHARTRAAVTGRTAKDIMVERDKLVTLKHGMTVQQASLAALKSLQEVFPVLYADQVIGVVGKDVLYAAHAQGDESYIAQYMSRDFISVGEDEPLEQIVARLEHAPQNFMGQVMVVKDGVFSGIITQNKLVDLLLLFGIPGQALKTQPKQPTERVSS